MEWNEILKFAAPYLSPGLAMMLTALVWVGRDKLNRYQETQNIRFDRIEEELRHVKIRLAKMMKLHSNRHQEDAPGLWAEKDEE